MLDVLGANPTVILAMGAPGCAGGQLRPNSVLSQLQFKQIACYIPTQRKISPTQMEILRNYTSMKWFQVIPTFSTISGHFRGTKVHHRNRLVAMHTKSPQMEVRTFKKMQACNWSKPLTRRSFLSNKALPKVMCTKFTD